MVLKDPEGILGPAQTGHIARKEFQRRLEKDSDAREAFERQVIEEKERRRAVREVSFTTWFWILIISVKLLVCDCFFVCLGFKSRVAPDTAEGLIEYFLDTEAREIEFEISRLRPRLVICIHFYLWTLSKMWMLGMRKLSNEKWKNTHLKFLL